MRGANQHLSGEEIEQLTGSATDVEVGALEGAMRHLERCEPCRFRMLFARDLSAVPLQGAGGAGAGNSPCPPEGRWLEVAAGLGTAAERKRYIVHAARCARCGQLLKEALEDVGMALTEEEETKVAALDSAQPEWQSNLAQKIADSAPAKVPVAEKPASSSKKFGFWPRWAGAFAALILAAGGGWWAWILLRAPSVDDLLAQAYTEQRTIEMRIPGAKYAPMRVERGPEESNLKKRPALLKAEALIAEGLQKNPNDPAWLQAKARADLLDGKYSDAIKSLQLALLSKPDSPELLTDLGSAYFQSADYGNAVEVLARALAKSPSDPVIVFNHALACEKFFFYTQAIDDWQHYLSIDPTGGWADEAREHLREIQKKVGDKQTSLRKPLLGIAAIASLNGSDEISHEIDNRVEDYLHAAVKEWLPLAFSQIARTEESQHARIALLTLADISLKNHADSWLQEVLTGSHGTAFVAGVNALSQAVTANDNGDYLKGRNSAEEAVKLFRSANNLAADLRAETEELYSFHLLYDGDECMKMVRRLSPRVQQHTYEWLRAQISLEESNCAGLLGNLGQTRIAIERGTVQAGEHRYLSLFLRGLGFQADAAASLGDTRKGFALALQGLSLFWSGQVDLMKGYNLYTDLDTAGDVLRLPYFQVALWDQATALIDMHPDLVQRAMAHRWYGNSAYLANMPDLAEAEFTKASALFNAAPQTEATARDYLDAEIWLAGLEARQGDLDHAASRLQQMRKNLESAPSFGPEIGYYSTQAEVSLRRQDYETADSALRSAIFLAEWALRSFPSESARSQWAKQTEGAYRNLVALKLRQGDVESALELWEWYRGAGFRTISNSTLPSSPLDLTVPPDARNAPAIQVPAVVANRLPALQEDTIVTYSALLDGLVVWVFDNRGIFSERITESPIEIESLATQFYQLCSTRDSNLAVLQTVSRRLYSLLIAPIERRLETGRTLVFELDSILSPIPMEALIDSGGRYLAERASVVVIPGFYQIEHQRPAVAITRNTPALIVSVPVPADDRFTPLPDAEKEARIVAGNFHSVRSLSGSNARLAAVRRGLRGALLFHFVGHASAVPEMTGLLLAERDIGTGRARLINGQSFSRETMQGLQLAVLSACNTWMPVPGATGTEDLTQALLRAGVPHVVASRWSVDSAQTLVFMSVFYEHMMLSNSVATSLHEAQVELAAQPFLAHPYYWAAFGLQGM